TAPPAPGRAAPEQLVRAWLTAIHQVCFVPMSRPERQSLMQRFADQLTAAMRSEPFDPSPGHAVGAGLVAADYAAPEVLGRTITVLQTRLLADLGLAGEAAEARLSTLLA